MDKNKILRYIEGQLNGSDKEAFEVLIESNSELQLEVERSIQFYTLFDFLSNK